MRTTQLAFSSPKQKFIYNHPILIKTINYQTETKDTLMGKPILCNHIKVIVYDDNTKKDSFINEKDPSHIYLCYLVSNKILTLVP